MANLSRFGIAALTLLAAHSSSHPSVAATFGEDVEFLKAHTEVVVLSDDRGQAKLAVVPAWQGRVMTSTAAGDAGDGYGWINRELIGSRKLQPHINALGGEDRFWLGPEGGQFSIFFPKGAKFDLEHWQTPPAIDTLPYKLAAKTASSAKCTAEFSLTNYVGTQFDVKVDRELRLLAAADAWRLLGIASQEDIALVAFESHNTIVNVGKRPWQKDTGLLSIWIPGMFNPSPGTTIVVPILEGAEADLGKRVETDYFGAIPPARLQATERAIFFSGDGQFRSKIGISPQRSRGVLGSYNADLGVLTIVTFTQPEGAVDYVNSLWELQEQPYAGDAANCYNDGPPAPGAKPLGPFYELESSSPGAALEPGESLSHTHRTMHLMGNLTALDAVARHELGPSLAEIEAALPK